MDLDASALLRRHVTFYGATQTGKTAAEVFLASTVDAPELHVFWDGKGNTKLPQHHVLRRPEAFDPDVLLSHPWVRIVPPGTSTKEDKDARAALAASVSQGLRDMGAVMHEASADGVEPWVLVSVDEVGRDAPASTGTGPFCDLATEGEGLGVIAHFLGQTARNVSPVISNNSAYIVLYRIGPQAYESLRTNHTIDVPPDVRRHVAKKYHFAVLDTLTGEWVTFEPLPL